MNRRVTLLLWVTIVGLAGVLGLQTYWSRTALRQAEAKLTALKQNLLRAEARLSAATLQSTRRSDRLDAQLENPATTEPVTPEEQILEALREKLAELERRHPKAERPLPLRNPFGGSRVAELLADPAYAQLYRSWYRANLEREYNELLATLSVAPETKARLVELLLDRQLAIMDVIGLSGANRWGPGNPPTKAQRAEADRAQEAALKRFDAEIQALLGREAYAQFDKYRRADGERRQLDILAQRLSYTEQPLTPTQRQKLFPSIETDLFPSDAATAEKTLAEMGKALSPVQLEAVQQLRAERAAQMQPLAPRQKE
ncbi:MAG: hypothetical protein ABIO94_02485 [Opitutaceae bacterium]